MKEEALAGWGARRLAAAMLLRAAFDMRSATKKRDVISWMRDSSEGELSFAFCCRVLGRDPHQVRSSLEQQADWLAKPAPPRFLCPKPPKRAASAETAAPKHPIRGSTAQFAS